MRSKRNSFTMLATVLGLVALCLTSCDDEPAGTRPSTFSLKLIVADTAGNRVPELSVSAWSRLPAWVTPDGSQAAASANGNKPATSFQFALSQQCAVTYQLFDVEGVAVQTLVQGVLPAGAHVVVWDGTRDAQPLPVPALAGVYRAVFTAQDPQTAELLHTAEVLAVMYLGPDPQQTVLGQLDSLGELTTTRKAFFPHLYERHSFMAMDENCNERGPFAYLDTVRVVLQQPGAGLSQRYDAVIIDGPNQLMLTWDPALATAHALASADPRSCPRSLEAAALANPGPVTKFEVHQNCPNPFN